MTSIEFGAIAPQRRRKEMPEFTREPTIDELKRALSSCYFLACRKRCVTYDYADPENPRPIGPKSDDADWDHIKRFGEGVGLTLSIVRASVSERLETENPAVDIPTSPKYTE